MNQKTIAKHFGVSVATVSKALNDAFDISPTLKEKIIDYAKKAGYKKNFSALALKQNHSLKTIAVVIPNFYNSFFSEVLKGITIAAKEVGFNTIVLETDESHEREVEVLHYLKSGIAEGIIISPASETIRLKSFDHLKETNSEIPIILFDRIVDEIPCEKITNDNLISAYKATQKLIENGCRSIGVLSDIQKLDIGKQRLLGVQKALKEANIPFYQEQTFFYSQNNFYSYQFELFFENDFDALFCMEENSLIKAKNFKVKSNISKIKNLKLVGYYNRKVFRGEIIKEIETDTIYVEQNGLKMGKLALNKLVDLLGKEAATQFEITIVESVLCDNTMTTDYNTV